MEINANPNLETVHQEESKINNEVHYINVENDMESSHDDDRIVYDECSNNNEAAIKERNDQNQSISSDETEKLEY